MTSNRDGANNIMWFLAGLGFGVLAGILYAPRSGDETREAMRESLEEAGGYVQDRGREVQQKVNSWVDQGKQVVSKTKSAVVRKREELSSSPAPTATERQEFAWSAKQFIDSRP